MLDFILYSLLPFLFILGFCVTIHEFGHALSAAKFGIKTRDITLLPIGGVARLERMPDKPIQELWVALAGPAVNIVIAVILFAWLTITKSWQPLDSLSVAGGSFLERLMVVNIFLVVFNILPAFPMDGGRVLRALLALKLEYTRATLAQARVPSPRNPRPQDENKDAEFVCVRCGQRWTGFFSQNAERTCPQCRSNSVRWLRPKP